MKKNKIVVFHIGGIGDSIHDLSVLKQIVSFCPRSQIFYVCKKGNEVLVDLAGLGDIIIKVPVNSKFDLLSLYFKLPFRPDTIVVCCGMNVRKIEYFLRCFFPKRAGASFPDYPDECLRKFRTKGSTFNVLVGPLHGAHRIFVNREVLRLLGIHGNLFSPLLDKHRVSSIDLPSIIDWNYDRPFAVLHHGAASVDSSKRWKESKWATVADKVIEQFKLDILLVGGLQEIESSREIVNSCNNKDRIYNATGKFSLSQLVRVISEAALVVGTDSGPGHIAGAVGTPLVSVFGPTSPSQVAPVTENGCIVHHPVHCGPCYCSNNYYYCPNNNICMNAISEESVIKAVRLVLGHSPVDNVIQENCDVITKCPTLSDCRDWSRSEPGKTI
ncbi:MAG: glycosyltransferase family 9 protein [Elusimicrobiota bacterium]